VYIQQDATLHILFISGNCSTCFGRYFHPSSGAHTTVSAASDICHNVTAVCRYRGRVGTGLSVLWVVQQNLLHPAVKIQSTKGTFKILVGNVQLFIHFKTFSDLYNSIGKIALIGNELFFPSNKNLCE
jgi:hypothetical protein